MGFGGNNMQEIKFPDYINDFLIYMETIKGKSNNTVKEYAYDLRTFIRFMMLHFNLIDSSTQFDNIEIMSFEINNFRKITLSDLYSYMSFISKERDNSATSRARKVASIKSLFNYLFSKAKLLDVNPAVELESPKIVKRLPKYMNIDESKSLLNSIDGKNKERDVAIVTLFLNCGLRLSELVGINLNKINGDTLTVIGKGNKERTIYLNDACLYAINSYLRIRPVNGVKDKNALFLSERKQRISPKTVQYLVKKYIKFAGLDTEKYSTHKLRHTAATLMYKHGKVDIRALQEILGHESISTTEIYTHVDNSQLRAAVEKNPLSSFVPDNKSKNKNKN